MFTLFLNKFGWRQSLSHEWNDENDHMRKWNVIHWNVYRRRSLLLRTSNRTSDAFWPLTCDSSDSEWSTLSDSSSRGVFCSPYWFKRRPLFCLTGILKCACCSNVFVVATKEFSEIVGKLCFGLAMKNLWMTCSEIPPKQIASPRILIADIWSPLNATAKMSKNISWNKFATLKNLTNEKRFNLKLLWIFQQLTASN